MICEKVYGSICDEEVHARLSARLGGYVVEEVPFTWDETHMRVQRKVGSEGTEVGLRLDEETRRRGLRNDDVLGVDAATQHVLVARITPEEAVAVEVEGADPLAVARVAWEVGNTHTPLFAGKAPGTFAFPLNEPLRAALERIPGVTARVACRAGPGASGVVWRGGPRARPRARGTRARGFPRDPSRPGPWVRGGVGWTPSRSFCSCR